jgi:hypothetical protein
MNTTGGVLVVLHEQHEDVVREMRERMIQKRERERERERNLTNGKVWEREMYSL